MVQKDDREAKDEQALLKKANQNLAQQILETEQQKSKLQTLNDQLKKQSAENAELAQQLQIANQELLLQNIEKEKRAQELFVANKELDFQNQEKEKRAQELLIANRELAFQNQEKENRAQELLIANIELAYQNQEKQNRANELALANTELQYQNGEKQKRAEELALANTELEFQNLEKEKRANELLLANKEIESFTYISSHDLQEPLRKIQSFSGRIFVEEYDNLSAMGKYYVERTKLSALHMQTLINDLLAYSRTSTTQRKFVSCDLNEIVQEAIAMLKEDLHEKQAVVKVLEMHTVTIIPFQFRQLLQNLISNSLKFCNPNTKPQISITSTFVKFNPNNVDDFKLNQDYFHISISDNGIGFEMQYKDKIFDIFQRLNDRNEYVGTGIGLTIARKIVENHHGSITATAKINEGATFDIYLPAVQ